MAKHILLILGHPSEHSSCKALLDAYETGSQSADAAANFKAMGGNSRKTEPAEHRHTK